MYFILTSILVNVNSIQSIGLGVILVSVSNLVFFLTIFGIDQIQKKIKENQFIDVLLNAEDRVGREEEERVIN